jgi:hypothetical protein
MGPEEDSVVAEGPGIDILIADVGLASIGVRGLMEMVTGFGGLHVFLRALLTAKTRALAIEARVARGLDPFKIDICGY